MRSLSPARMGSKLAHLHLADGRGAAYDEHLIPGQGSQPCVEVCQLLMHTGFTGQCVIEVNTQNVRTTLERASMLRQSLTFARTHLSTAAPSLVETADTGDEHRDA